MRLRLFLIQQPKLPILRGIFSILVPFEEITPRRLAQFLLLVSSVNQIVKHMYMCQITTFYALHQNTQPRKNTTITHDRIYPYLYPSDVPLKPKTENLDN